jgi:hypothetical protein
MVAQFGEVVGFATLETLDNFAGSKTATRVDKTATFSTSSAAFQSGRLDVACLADRPSVSAVGIETLGQGHKSGREECEDRGTARAASCRHSDSAHGGLAGDRVGTLQQVANTVLELEACSLDVVGRRQSECSFETSHGPRIYILGVHGVTSASCCESDGASTSKRVGYHHVAGIERVENGTDHGFGTAGPPPKHRDRR